MNEFSLDEHEDGLLLDLLSSGPKSWPEIRRYLHVMGSESRPKTTRRQLARLGQTGRIQRHGDQYRLKVR